MNYDTCDGMTYTIKQGDTLYGISRKYDVPLAMILHANPYADVYRLNVGDTICIPVKKKCCTKPENGESDSGMERKATYNMENNITGSINVSGNTTDMSRNTNISGNTNMSDIGESMGASGNMSDIKRNDNALRGDMQRSGSENATMRNITDNMDLPDKTAEMRKSAGEERISADKASADDNWVKYVAQPGDTLFDVFNRSKCDLNEFLNKNGLKGIYILPGLVYFVKEK